MKLEALDDLIASRWDMRIRMVKTIGQQGWMTLDGDPDALVTELLRLARIGLLVELSAARRMETPAGGGVLDLKRS